MNNLTEEIHEGCSQYPLCLECHNTVEDSDLPYRVCVNCGIIEWDEFSYCTECSYDMVHDCKSDHWHCSDEICKGIAQAEYEAGEMFDYLLEQAGGLDEVQRQERLRYYGEE